MSLEEDRSLLKNMGRWVELKEKQHMQHGFERIKLRMVYLHVRKLGRASNFDSISSTTSNDAPSLTSYVSIGDFKPILNNYSSVQILGTKPNAQEKKKFNFSEQQLDRDDFLESWMMKSQAEAKLLEEYPKLEYSSRKITSYHEEALQSIRQHPFSEYVKLNVRRKVSLFGLLESDAMDYKKKSISNSITYLNEGDVDTALDMFDLLLKVGGEVPSKRGYLAELSYFLKLASGGNDDLREEGYLQMIKQMSSKQEPYLRAFCCMAAVVKPSARMYIPLLNMLLEDYNDYDNQFLKEYYNFAFYSLIKSFNEPRKSQPSLFELSCLYHIRSVPITVCFPKEKMFFIELYTTVEEFIGILIGFYNLDRKVEYLLEVNNILLEKGCLLDEFNRCSSREDEQKYEQHLKFVGFRAVIVLKDVSDAGKYPMCHNIMYNYCTMQYLRGLYALRSLEIIRIAALKMNSEMGNEENYRFQLPRLVINRRMRTMNEQEMSLFKQRILKKYFQLKGQSKADSRKEILAILGRSKGFNTHFFKCQVFLEDFEEVTAWVGVHPQRLLVVEPATGRVMRIIHYTKIREWGRSLSELCVKADGLGQFHMDTPQVQTLVSIFSGYLQAIEHRRKGDKEDAQATVKRNGTEE